jgi:DNA-binding response OmpR family regulator
LLLYTLSKRPRGACRVLIGKRILIVEDEPLIAIDLATAIEDVDGVVVGPAGTLLEATTMAETERLDGAILDLRLRDALTLSVAESLQKRDVPFVIHSGQAEITLPRNWPSVPIIDKPAPPEQVLRLLAALLRG